MLSTVELTVTKKQVKGADLAGGVNTQLVEGVIDSCLLLGLDCP